MLQTRALLSAKPISPEPINSNISVADLVDKTFWAYNAGRFREDCQLFTEKMLKEDVTVGLSLAGALTPAGLGMSCIIPIIDNGFVDWIVSTGANLYHDTHFALGLSMHQGTFKANDVVLCEQKIVRIYDIFFDYEVLLSTDAFYRKIIDAPEFNKTMSTAEFHYLIGKYVHEREKALGLKNKSLLSAAYLAGVPIYTPSPGDSSIGMNIAAKALQGHPLKLDVSADVYETAAIVLNAKRTKGKSGILILGGGSPKNFLLQTEPQIQEVLGIAEKGHDYFLQFTDTRTDSGSLSGATPSEAVSWGKVDPAHLPDAVTCYCDSTIALPLLTAYALSQNKSRQQKQLYQKRKQMLKKLTEEYLLLEKVKETRIQ